MRLDHKSLTENSAIVTESTCKASNKHNRHVACIYVCNRICKKGPSTHIKYSNFDEL